jgi:heme exporter protein B
MRELILQELKVQNKIYNIIKYSLIFFIFCCLSVGLISSYEDIQAFGIVFAVISIPLAFIGLSYSLIKPDIEDGTIETLLTKFPASNIIIAKYIALCICFIISFGATMPIIYVMYNVEVVTFIIMIASAIILLLLSAALIILIASIQGYFKANTNFLSVLIMPLLIPNIILSGLLIQNNQDTHLLFIMIGINFVIIPPVLYLSGYLVENIYNI